MSTPPGQEHSPTPEEAGAESAGIATSGAHTESVCPVCGSHNREQSQFCSDCGAGLLKYCPQCGRQVAIDDDICDDCSASERQTTSPAGRCQSCGCQNDQGAESCGHCGARLLVKCPHCGAVAPASFSFCPRCGFHYSRLVTDRLVGGLQGSEEQSKRPAPRFNFSLALMIVLIVVSVVVMIYIFSQI